MKRSWSSALYWCGLLVIILSLSLLGIIRVHSRLFDEYFNQDTPDSDTTVTKITIEQDVGKNTHMRNIEATIRVEQTPTSNKKDDDDRKKKRSTTKTNTIRRQKQEEITSTNPNNAQQQQDDNKKKEPMNILFLYADDWSYETLGAMGNKYVKTPMLDKLAQNGMLFTHNCVVSSICMQSRATLYTGQYASRHQTYFAWKNVTMYDHWDTTLYPLMMDAGYHVGFFGKYHHLEPWPRHIPTFTESRSYQGSHYFMRDGKLQHVTHLNEMDGMEFLNKRPRDKPFFLTVSFFATHAEDGSEEQYRPMNSSMKWYAEDGPVPHPKTYTEKHWNLLPPFFNSRNFGRGRFWKRYRNHELYDHHMKNTYRMVTEVDAASGRLIDKLKEQNVLDNTLIIFTTDNGNSHGQHGLAEKWYAYEESLRVPLIIQDPRMPSSMIGTKNSEFTLNIDLAPTILSAAGVPVPSVMQGQDMAPLYLQPEIANPNWRKEFLYEFWYNMVDIPGSLALVQKDFKYIYWAEHRYPQYFDLQKDPYEEYDLVNMKNDHNVTTTVQQQQPNYQAIQKRMYDLYHRLGRQSSTCQVHCWETPVAASSAAAAAASTTSHRL